MRGDQQQSKGDSATNFFWLIALLAGGVMILWYVDHTIITEIIFTIRAVEILFLHWFIDAINGFLTVLGLPTIDMGPLDLWMTYIHNHAPDKIGWPIVTALSAEVGNWIRWPTAILITISAVLLYFKAPGARFRNTYTMRSLHAREIPLWPETTPIADLNLARQNIHEGPWAMSLTPLEFCNKHDLANPIINPTNKEQMVWKVKRGPANRIFMMQLGSLWGGLLQCPIHMQAIMVILLLSVNGKRKEARQLIRQIAASARNREQLNFKGVPELAMQLKDHKLLKWLTRRHAYVSTVLCTLLTIARYDGVIASADFLWLKAVDRRNWYVICNVGRQASFSEAAGVVAHWFAEKKVDRALKVPMVREAVVGLENAMLQVLFVQEKDSWHHYAD